MQLTNYKSPGNWKRFQIFTLPNNTSKKKISFHTSTQKFEQWNKKPMITKNELLTNWMLQIFLQSLI